MEEDLTLAIAAEKYREAMHIHRIDETECSPLVLAYIGDAVYEVFIRLRSVGRGNTQVNTLHKHSTALVKASAQAALFQAVEEELTPEEHSVYRRGRNAKSYTVAKNASVREYRKATGFEALVGWLFLKGEYLRLVEIISFGLTRIGEFEEEDKTPAEGFVLHGEDEKGDGA